MRTDILEFYRIGKIYSKSIDKVARATYRFLTRDDAIKYIMETEKNPRIYPKTIDLGKTIINKIERELGEGGYFIFRDPIKVKIY